MHLTELDWQLTIIIVIVILGVIISFFLISLLRHQRNFIALQKDRMKAEVEALENERKRVATDLHDELGPFLSAVKLQINSLDTTIPSDTELIKKVSTNIDSIVKNIRKIANNLMPTILLRKGLNAALLDFINTIQIQFPLQINYYNETNIALNTTAQINIFRIVQELVHNTIKHSNCSELLIKLYISNKQLILLSQDNGKGFTAPSQKDNTNIGLGLRNLETRAEILNGSMELNTEPGKGCAYVFEFPLQEIIKKEISIT